MDAEKLNNLEAQLAPQNQTENVKSAGPSQQLISDLLEHYQKGRFSDAESLATNITQEFPRHQFGWKALGAIYGETGRISDSLVPNQKSVQFAAMDAEAHYNLGITLKELGKLDQAEACFKQAIDLDIKKPHYVTAYANCITYLNEARSAHTKLEKLWEESSLETGNGIRLPLAINRFLMGDLKGCRQILLSYFSSLSEPQKLEQNDINNYWGWLRDLLEWHDKNPRLETHDRHRKRFTLLGIAILWLIMALI